MEAVRLPRQAAGRGCQWGKAVDRLPDRRLGRRLAVSHPVCCGRRAPESVHLALEGGARRVQFAKRTCRAIPTMVRVEGPQNGRQRGLQLRQRAEEVGGGAPAGGPFARRAAAIVGHQVQEPLGLPPVEMDDGQQVPHLLRAEVVDLAGHLAEDGARVDHQHLAAEALRLGAVQEPQLARYGPGVEEVGADGDHDLHVAGLHQLAAHRGFGAAGARRLRRHHEAGPAVPVQVAVEVADPDVVAVADARPPVDAGQTERQARIGLDLLGVDFVHVERRIAIT